METVQKNEFIAFRFKGYANESLFDSNIEVELKKLDPKAKAEESIIVVGKGMVVPGLDRSFEGKEIGKEYEINLEAKDGFGERRRELVKTIPLKTFTDNKINPYPGLSLTLDGMLAKIITISGARVVTDFNNPLAGKKLRYVFTVTRKVIEDKERAESLFKVIFRMVPEFEIKESIIVKGPEILEQYVKAFSPQFKELMGRELSFELKEEEKSDKNDLHEHSHEHNHEN
ncbi:FKBP-type peptidyl-prolyl cis-trans isomerase [Candidatus Pacearchaeota archaeon]|nr:FKBP-type peptidyl-prolyl cis-trans isomerase [Candidatus Pacearchaeota archaeon]